MADRPIDMTALSAKHTAPETARRVKRRHWAEIRLRAYGILAIATAVLALVILVYTIFSNMFPINTVDLSIDSRILVSHLYSHRPFVHSAFQFCE